jgi:hypothetical protein
MSCFPTHRHFNQIHHHVSSHLSATHTNIHQFLTPTITIVSDAPVQMVVVVDYESAAYIHAPRQDPSLPIYHPIINSQPVLVIRSCRRISPAYTVPAFSTHYPKFRFVSKLIYRRRAPLVHDKHEGHRRPVRRHFERALRVLGRGCDTVDVGSGARCPNHRCGGVAGDAEGGSLPCYISRRAGV